MQVRGVTIHNLMVSMLLSLVYHNTAIYIYNTDSVSYRAVKSTQLQHHLYVCTSIQFDVN